MKKNVLSLFTVITVGIAGFAFAQDATQVAKAQAKPMVSKKSGHPHIVQLKDRIQNQLNQIKEGMDAGTLSATDAEACRAVLNSVVAKMKAVSEKNGSNKITTEQYAAYNTTLDSNSAALKEDKQYFYYYGPYVDMGPYYDYYYEAYSTAGSPTPQVSPAEETHPKIFELKERLKNQSARIKQGVDNNTLTSDQAKDCRVVLKSAEKQMKADLATNHSNKLTKDQYTSLNNSLDANSNLIQEEKQYFYSYGDPSYVQYYYWY
jgi:hypothetical protein